MRGDTCRCEGTRGDAKGHVAMRGGTCLCGVRAEQLDEDILPPRIEAEPLGGGLAEEAAERADGVERQLRLLEARLQLR